MPISDIQYQDLRDKVNSVAQTQDEQVLPALKDIKDTVKGLAFVSQKDFDTSIKALQKQIDDNKKQQDTDHELLNKGGVKAANILTGSVSRIFFGALAVGIVILIIYAIVKISPAIYGGQP